MRKAKINLNNKILESMNRNSLTRQFRKAFNTAFRINVLPEIEKNKSRVFTKDDPKANLYCTKRSWRVGDESSKNFHPLVYEEYLHDLFWNKERLSPLVIIEGDVGTGKSTFIEYFLRCFCPTQSEKSNEFKNKLPIVVDLSTVTSQNYEEELFTLIRQSIDSAVPFQLDEEDDYAMYDPILKYSSKAWKDALGGKTEMQFRAEKAVELRARLSNREWTTCALKYLSSASNNTVYDRKKRHYRYVVLCLDNIDQRSEDVQKQTLQLAKRWIDDCEISLWQIYLPMWPKTYQKICHSHTSSPISEHEYVPLGSVDASWIREKRQKLHIDEIRHEPNAEEGPGDPPEKSSEIGILFLKETFNFVRPAFIKKLRRLSDGNLRVERELWKEMLASNSLYRKYLNLRGEKPKLKKASKLGLYDHWDGLITGYRDVHHRNKSQIRNIFYANLAPCGFRNLLIGPHLLSVIYRMCGESGEVSIQPIREQLTNYGYNLESIEEALSYFDNTVIDYFSDKAFESIRVRVNIVAEYIDLITNPAYLDNMAMVTPLPSSIAGKIFHTKSYEPSLFVSRTISTLSFILQLKRDEDRFCDPSNCANGISNERFIEQMNSYPLNRISNIAANQYKTRLIALKKGQYLKKYVSDDTWSEIMSHDIFSETSLLDQHLVVKR